MTESRFRKALTFDDILLVPKESGVLPNQTCVKSRLSRNIEMHIPLISAAMDTVTESKTSIAMARGGGLGVIHKNMLIEEQVEEVRKVKRSESGMVDDPVVIEPGATVGTAVSLMQEHRISGLPVTENETLVGIVTGRDLRFEDDLSRSIKDVMTKEVVTAPDKTTPQEAVTILHRHRIEKLPVLNALGKLVGMFTIKDIEKSIKHPHSSKDSKGRLFAGAAIGAHGDYLERAEALLQTGADVLVLDTAHAHSVTVLGAVKTVVDSFRKKYDFELIAGNVVTKEATRALIENGVDAVKVGIGPGSICTTRIISGVGVPQITAIMDCVAEAKAYDVPIIADGGVKYSGDIVKALALGAGSVMIGGLFAGTDEAPGEMVLYQGKSYKTYRGMGSLGAMKKGSRDRYFQGDVDTTQKLVPEGIEGRVAYKGPLSSTVYQLIGGLRSAMGYLGAASLDDLRAKAEFVEISHQGYKESHIHNVFVTQEAPNYRQDAKG